MAEAQKRRVTAAFLFVWHCMFGTAYQSRAQLTVIHDHLTFAQNRAVRQTNDTAVSV